MEPCLKCECCLKKKRFLIVFLQIQDSVNMFKSEEFDGKKERRVSFVCLTRCRSKGMMRSSMQLLSALQKNPSVSEVCKLFSNFVDSALASYSGYCSGERNLFFWGLFFVSPKEGSGTYSVCSDLWLKNNNPKWIAFRKKVFPSFEFDSVFFLISF